MRAEPALTAIDARRRPVRPLPVDYDRLATLFAIQGLLAEGSAIEEACDETVGLVARTLRVRTAVLLQAEPSSGRAALWAAPGVAANELGRAYTHAWTALEYLARDGAASTLAAVRLGALPGEPVAAGLVPPHYVTLPLVRQRTVVGVFQLEGAWLFAERDLLFLDVIAGQLALAVERHRLRVELERSRARLAHVNQRLEDVQAIAVAMLACGDVASALPAMLVPLTTMFGADVAAALLVDPDGTTLRCRAAVGLEPGAEGMVMALGTGAAGRIALAHGATAVYELAAVVELHPALRASGVRSLLGAPLRSRDRLIGVVYVAAHDERRFSEDEHRLLELVADRIGVVLDSVDQHEKALAAIHSRDVMMGLVSHDLRNPVSTIQLCLELLPPDEPASARALSMIERSVDVMLRLISDLRDVGAIESGRLSMDRRRVDARAVIADVVDAMRERAARQGQRLRVSVPAAPLWVRCDRVRILQVLSNLLGNAIKFTPAGGAIAVAASEVGADVWFTVADDGDGIPAADLPRVFEPFWQARGTAHLGSGLGLAISRGIVLAHGGTISVASGADGGATFSFTVPRAGGGDG